MSFGSWRTIFIVMGALVFSLLGVGSAMGQAGQAGQAGADRPPMAEQVFKNVQVLKGIPVDEFMDTMGMIAASLSMNCTDCHTSDSTSSWVKFADETDIKKTARRMMLMVAGINRNNFMGKPSVTCYTCHRGDQKPKVVPSLTIQYGTPVEDPNDMDIFPDPSAPSADQILQKYIQAIGGAQPVGNLMSYAAKGTYEGYDTDHAKVPVEIYAKAPNQRTSIVHALFGDKIQVYDGRAGWVSSADKPMPLMTLTGGNLEGAKVEATMFFPSRIRQAFSQWKVGSTTIEDKEVYVLQGTNTGQPPVNAYFDKNSGLLVRLVRWVVTPIGTVPTQFDYSDYRAVSGVKVPFKIITTWTDGQTTVELNQVQFNTTVDAAKFAKPAPAPPPKLQ